MGEACRWGWGAWEGLPCWAWGEGSCDGLLRRAWRGSSCCRWKRSPSREVGSVGRRAIRNKLNRNGSVSIPKKKKKINTGGPWPPLCTEDRGGPPWWLWGPPPDVGSGPSPSSAMSDRYSLSIRALSCADCGGSPPVALWAAKVLSRRANGKTFSLRVGNESPKNRRPFDGHLVYLQSEEMWPAPPHLVHRVVLVMLRGSVFCQGRRILRTRRVSIVLSCWTTGVPLASNNTGKTLAVHIFTSEEHVNQMSTTCKKMIKVSCRASWVPD